MKKIVSLLLTTLILTGCSFDNKEKEEPFEPDPTPKPLPDPTPDPDYKESFYEVQNEDEMYKKLYDYQNKISLTLDFTNKAIKKEI